MSVGEPLRITYRLTMEDDSKIEIPLQLQPVTLDLIDLAPTAPPDWTRLEHFQCPNCPLSPEEHPYCPLSTNLVNVVHKLDSLRSYDKVRLDVVTEGRHIYHNTTAQKAISSLLGLISAASGCPNTAFFKPMARFHLPLANSNETMYRVISMYLMAQYFRQLEGGAPDMDLTGLIQIYQDVEVVNQYIAKRLASVTVTDSSLNAIVILDLYAKTFPLLIVEDALLDTLNELRGLFSSFLDQTTST